MLNGTLGLPGKNNLAIINQAIKQSKSVMPDLIRHPVIPLDSGFRRNDKPMVFIRRFNIILGGSHQPGMVEDFPFDSIGIG